MIGLLRAEKNKSSQHRIIWDDNSVVQGVVGSGNCHLIGIEKKLGITISLRGNEVLIQGDTGAVERAVEALNAAYDIVSKGRMLTMHEMELLVSSNTSKGVHKELLTIGSRSVCARNARQIEMLHKLQRCGLNFVLGVAGTGKTYLAVAYGLKSLLNGSVKKLVLSRPAIEAGEQLGFLPGDMKEKVDPYMQPLYDALYDLLGSVRVERMIENKTIEIAPLAFMRGRTLSQSFVVLDEAQNATRAQMKMFLTRLGEGSRMVVTGDPYQIDLPRGKDSGLEDAVHRLSAIDDIGIVRFSEQDVVRHGLVTKIIKAYND